MRTLQQITLALLSRWWRLTVPWRLRRRGVAVGMGATFYGMPIVSMIGGSRIRIGDRAVLCSDSRFTALGVNHPVILRTLRPNAEIIIGADCGISGGSICAAIRVELGKECLLGANVTITDTDFHAIKPDHRRYNNNESDIATTPVIISDNVFIGAGAVILKGVEIGRNSVVGAYAIVSHSIPADKVAVGNPAQTIKNVIFK